MSSQSVAWLAFNHFPRGGRLVTYRQISTGELPACEKWCKKRRCHAGGMLPLSVPVHKPPFINKEKRQRKPLVTETDLQHFLRASLAV